MSVSHIMSRVLAGGIGRSVSTPAGTRTRSLIFFLLNRFLKFTNWLFCRISYILDLSAPSWCHLSHSFVSCIYCTLEIRIEAILNRFIKVGLTEKVVFEQRLERGEEVSHAEK